MKRFNEFILESKQSKEISIEELDDEFLRLEEVLGCKVEWSTTDGVSTHTDPYELPILKKDELEDTYLIPDEIVYVKIHCDWEKFKNIEIGNNNRTAAAQQGNFPKEVCDEIIQACDRIKSKHRDVRIDIPNSSVVSRRDTTNSFDNSVRKFNPQYIKGPTIYGIQNLNEYPNILIIITKKYII